MQKRIVVYGHKLLMRGQPNSYWASFDCDGCHKKIAKPECNACERMVNYFKIFNIPQNYRVNIVEISEKAKNLQKEFHPDKNFAAEEANSTENYSSYINSAKSTLVDDLKRAEYLLSLRGIRLDEQQNKIHDSKFMADMFELQQEIEQAQTNEQINQIKHRIEEVLEKVKGEIDRMFERGENEKCVQFVFKYRYLYRALMNLKKKMAEQQN